MYLCLWSFVGHFLFMCHWWFTQRPVLELSSLIHGGVSPTPQWTPDTVDSTEHYIHCAFCSPGVHAYDKGTVRD